ncbi:MAG TPA: twin-arginine translocase TatA/TatE family subunit [Anaerolineae bacterium]|jgi:sec-independent protein translocase protein TatA
MDIGVPELLIIAVIIILLFGVGRIGKVGGELGKGIREFRAAVKDDESADATKSAAPAVAAPAGAPAAAGESKPVV